MNWLITGGCGFVGVNLIHRLSADTDNRVRVVDNLSVGTIEDLSSVTPCQPCEAPAAVFSAPGAPVEIVVADVRDPQPIAAAARGADVIVHLAASTGVIPSIDDPLEDCRCNVLGTVHALDAARLNDVTTFILASSGAPLGDQEPPIHEKKLPKPISPYGASKLAGEAYCSAYHGSFGIDTIALRFGNVYGPRSRKKQSVVAKFIRQAMAGETLSIHGDGRQTRDFISVEDLVDSICLAAASGCGGEVFQIASSRETTVNEVAKTLASILRELIGIEVSIVHRQPRVGEVRRSSSDISKARELLGWYPRGTLEDGLRETVAWFLEQGRAGDIMRGPAD